MQERTIEQWRELILAGWEKWGSGTPLDPKTVEHLAQEFAKPLMPERIPYWHNKEPFVKITLGQWPWER